jgi:hypothetical protein
MDLQLYLQDFLLLAIAHFLALISPVVDFFIIINSTLKYGKKSWNYYSFWYCTFKFGLYIIGTFWDYDYKIKYLCI